MTNRKEVALEVLKAGGCFRMRLEFDRYPRGKFVTRLFSAAGAIVPGVGAATFRQLRFQGLLSVRPTGSSTVEDHVLTTRTEGYKAGLEAGKEAA